MNTESAQNQFNCAKDNLKANDHHFTLPYRFIQLCLMLFIGIGIGYLYFIVFTNYASNCKVAYISTDEIISLEKERVNNLPENKEKKLFFGKANEALMLIDSIAKSCEDKNTKIVFVNDKFVRGKNVASISKQVYKTLVDKLSEEKEERNYKKDSIN